MQYHFRYDPVDISRICLFRNGEWVGDGYARELQQADGTVRHISLAEWKMAKGLAGSVEGKTPAELALVSDLQTLAKQRTQEKKSMQRSSALRSKGAADEARQDTTAAPKDSAGE